MVCSVIGSTIRRAPWTQGTSMQCLGQARQIALHHPPAAACNLDWTDQGKCRELNLAARQRNAADLPHHEKPWIVDTSTVSCTLHACTAEQGMKGVWRCARPSGKLQHTWQTGHPALPVGSAPWASKDGCSLRNNACERMHNRQSGISLLCFDWMHDFRVKLS